MTDWVRSLEWGFTWFCIFSTLSFYGMKPKENESQFFPSSSEPDPELLKFIKTKKKEALKIALVIGILATVMSLNPSHSGDEERCTTTDNFGQCLD